MGPSRLECATQVRDVDLDHVICGCGGASTQSNWTSRSVAMGRLASISSIARRARCWAPPSASGRPRRLTSRDPRTLNSILFRAHCDPEMQALTVNGQLKIPVGGQKFSRPADSKNPGGRTVSSR